MKSESWLTLSVLKGCGMHTPCLWPCVLRRPQPGSNKNSPLEHKHWPSRSHLTTNSATSRNQTLFHLSYAYPESARGCGSDDILKVFFRISMSLLNNCAQSTERNICLLRNCPKKLNKRSLSGGWVQKSHKRNLLRVYIWYLRKKKNQLGQTYLHKVPYIDLLQCASSCEIYHLEKCEGRFILFMWKGAIHLKMHSSILIQVIKGSFSEISAET